MKYFTYKDYIACIHRFRLHAVMQLAEQTTKYKIEREGKDYSHDKLVKSILKDKKELVLFMEEFLDLKEIITKEDIVKYSNSYVSRRYKGKEADLVYYDPKKEIFFLIEHQSSVDPKMPYRILNYCIDIMQDWGKNKKIYQTTRYPVIIPIVIYTGDAKWKVPTNFSEKQIPYEGLEQYKIDLNYNLININYFSYKTLLAKRNMFGYAMVIEKAKDKKELIRNLNWIIEKESSKEKLEEMVDIIRYLLEGVLEKGVQEELIDQIGRKVGERNMSNLYERIQAENRKLKQEGKQEGRQEGRKIEKIEMIRNMVCMKIKDEIIIKVSRITKEELEKIKKEIEIVA